MSVLITAGAWIVGIAQWVLCSRVIYGHLRRRSIEANAARYRSLDPVESFDGERGVFVLLAFLFGLGSVVSVALIAGMPAIMRWFDSGAPESTVEKDRRINALRRRNEQLERELKLGAYK